MRSIEYFFLYASVKINGKYEFKSVSEGNGPLHKYVLKNKINERAYFVKRGSYIIDLWQSILLRMIESPYKSLAFFDTAARIKRLKESGILREQGVYIHIGKWVSVYRYCPSISSCNEKVRKRLLQTLINHGFAHLDPSMNNFACVGQRTVMLDLESIVPQHELRESISAYCANFGLEDPTYKLKHSSITSVLDVVSEIEAMQYSENDIVYIKFDENFIALDVKIERQSKDNKSKRLEIGIDVTSAVPYSSLKLVYLYGHISHVRTFLQEIYEMKNSIKISNAHFSAFLMKKLYRYNPVYGVYDNSFCYRDYFLWNVFISKLKSFEESESFSINTAGLRKYKKVYKSRLFYLFYFFLFKVI